MHIQSNLQNLQQYVSAATVSSYNTVHVTVAIIGSYVDKKKDASLAVS